MVHMSYSWYLFSPIIIGSDPLIVTPKNDEVKSAPGLRLYWDFVYLNFMVHLVLKVG